jgi:hypothetical protein
MSIIVEALVLAIVAPISLVGEVLATTITLAFVGAIESIASIIPGSRY